MKIHVLRFFFLIHTSDTSSQCQVHTDALATYKYKNICLTVQPLQSPLENQDEDLGTHGDRYHTYKDGEKLGGSSMPLHKNVNL